jgi:hypothetical protein
LRHEGPQAADSLGGRQPITRGGKLRVEAPECFVAPRAFRVSKLQQTPRTDKRAACAPRSIPRLVFLVAHPRGDPLAC